MNIKGLRAYTQIMATGTLGAAANTLHISESALSRQLSILEAELGLTLFSREKRRLVPTSEGEAFYREAERLLDSIEQIPEIAEQIRRGLHRRMRIIVMPRVAPAIAVPAVAQFHDERPDVEISIEVQPRRYLERWLASQQFDLGVGALPANHAAIDTEQICRVPAVAVLGKDHPMAGRRSVTARELVQESLILLPQTTLIGAQVARILENAGADPSSPVHVSDTTIACSFAAHGHGITITDALIPHMFRGTVKIIPIEPRAHFDFGLLYPRTVKRNAETERLVELIKSQARAFVDGLGFD